MASTISDDLRNGALVYHRSPRPGKLEIQPTKPLGNQRDLALAYSPGVAAACEAIVADPAAAADLTIRANLVAVVSNGTAVLGLGNIGPLAGKPVMEGKAVLFKKFAGIDVFDIEIDAHAVDHVVSVVSALEPTFGGINLEDFKAPECFDIEDRLKERMKIPVFHDDQHGTAIIVAAAVQNALALTGKKIGEVKIVASGAGAAALACLNLLVAFGVKRENIWVSDIEGVVYEGREKLMDRWKSVYAQKTDKRTLGEVIDGADIFLGLSAPGVLKPEMVQRMAPQPLIMALANPTPEITPEEAVAARPDAMICTGRSDYPNQVNNVLCFPYIFRGALDVGATTINEAMKQAAVNAIAALAREAPSEVAARAYGGEARTFGKGSLIPNPFDPRLILRIAPAVAKAACESGVAARPITDYATYEERLNRFVFRSGFIMKPVFTQAKAALKRVIYAEGEDERILRATQVVAEEGLAYPLLIGRPAIVETRLERYGLSIRPGRDFELINPDDDPRYRTYVNAMIEAAGRKGVTPDAARTLVRTNATVIAALALKQGLADAMICGVEGRYMAHLTHIRDIIGLAPGSRIFAALTTVITAEGRLLPRRHPHQSGPGRGGDRRDGDPGGRACPPVWRRAEDRAAVALGFRLLRVRIRPQAARGAGADPRAGAGTGSGRRDERRVRADAGVPQPRLSALAPDRRGERADHAQHRRRQHQLSNGEGVRRRAARRADSHGRGASGAHPDALDHRARRGEYDGLRRRRSAAGCRKPTGTGISRSRIA